MRLALLGNHQARTLALAAGVMLEGADIRVFHASPIPEDVDHILAQPASVDDALRRRHGPRLTTIAAFECPALFPDACRLDGSATLHSALVLDAFLRGLSEAAAIRCFDLDNLQRLGLLDPWPASFARLRGREQDSAVDIPGVSIMEEACGRYPAFVGLDRPTAPFLADYLAAVFRALGIAHTDMNPLAVPEATGERGATPILDEVAEYHRLPYRTAQLWTTATGARLTRPDYIAAAYATYRDTPRDQLLIRSPIDLRSPPAAQPSHDQPAPDPSRNLHATARALDEAELYARKIHTYAARIDPQIEHLTQQITALRTSLTTTHHALATSAPRRTWRFITTMAALAALLLLATETILLLHWLR